MKNKVITISRQFGSGGRTIGKITAQRLSIPCYDAELINKIAMESGFTKQYIKEYSEYTPNGSWFLNGFLNSQNMDYIWEIQCKIILELGQKESCVIVGRCADFILKDKVDCLKVFIHADDEKRAERIVKSYGETDISVQNRINDKDKKRRIYYQFYTDMKWGECRNYDIALDSGRLGIEKCVDIICGAY